MLLFVYGTLRRGGDNHAKLDGARYLSATRTEACYQLVDMGGYPAVLEGGCSAVVGELYEVDESLSRVLDEFEDVPVLYERKRIRLDPAAQATERHHLYPFADAYVLPRPRAVGAPALTSGDWLSTSDISTVTVVN